MERLTGEARDRVRATSLSLVVSLTILGVIIGIYAVVFGFERVTAVPSEVVAVSADGRQITVELEYGGCQEPAGVDVEEGDDVVVLTAHVTERVRPQGTSCPDVLTTSRQSVVLEAPLDDRELRTTAP